MKTFNSLSKGDYIYIQSRNGYTRNNSEEEIKSIRKKKNKIEILTEDEYWYIPIEFGNEYYKQIISGDITIYICSDIEVFKEVIEK